MFLYNKIMLKKESSLISTPPGQTYKVNGHKMHIYTEGTGDKTLVFMAAFGETTPTYSYRKLYSKLSDTFKIVIIEKAGYGYSEQTDISRDIDTLVYENRTLLQKANIEPPYVLVSYSMSGLEALYWLQKFPEEISGIISLEMSLPDDYTKEVSVSKIADIGVRLGITRLPVLYNVLYDASYTEKEWNIIKAFWFKNAYNKTVQNEATYIYSNSKKIDLNKLDYSKFFLNFMNNSTISDSSKYYSRHKNFGERFNYNKLYLLNSSHTKMIRDEADYISEKIKENLKF